MRKKGDTICLGNHQFPCGLNPICPHTHEQDETTHLTVYKVSTDELFEMVADDDSGHDGDFSETYIGSEEFEDCEWIVYEGEDGGVAVELVKDESHIESVIQVESWLAEAVSDLSWALEEVYYDGDDYWYENIVTEEKKEELRQYNESISASAEEVKETFEDC